MSDVQQKAVTPEKPKKIMIIELIFWGDVDVDTHALREQIMAKFDLLGQGGHALAERARDSQPGKEIKFTTVSYEDRPVKAPE